MYPLYVRGSERVCCSGVSLYMFSLVRWGSIAQNDTKSHLNDGSNFRTFKPEVYNFHPSVSYFLYERESLCQISENHHNIILIDGFEGTK